MFKRFIEFLDSRGVSPDRVGQEEQADGSVIYCDNAPVIFSSEGERFTLGPNGIILDGDANKVGSLELWEDWHWQAMNMAHDAIEAAQT